MVHLKKFIGLLFGLVLIFLSVYLFGFDIYQFILGVLLGVAMIHFFIYLFNKFQDYYKKEKRPMHKKFKISMLMLYSYLIIQVIIFADLLTIKIITKQIASGFLTGLLYFYYWVYSGGRFFEEYENH